MAPTVSSGLGSFIMKLAHDGLTLALLVITCVLLGVTLNQDSARMPLLLTGTFYSTYYTNHPELAWKPPTDPDDPARVAAIFYGCLQTAGVGGDALTKCDPGLAPPDYASCLRNSTRSVAFLGARLRQGIQQAVGVAQANAAVQSTLGLQTTGFAAVTTMLANFSQFAPLTGANPSPSFSQLASLSAQLGLATSYLASLDTPYARAFQKTVAGAAQLQGIAGCIDGMDASAGVMNPLVPVYDQLWRCASEILPTTLDQALAFQQCVPLSAWPALDELQTPYSAVFLGSFNRGFVLAVAAWILSSFAVYTVWAGEAPANALGKPAGWRARAGITLCGVAAAWNALGGLVMIAARAFGNPADQKGFPMTVQTVFLTGAAMLLASGYFLREFWEQLGISFWPPSKAAKVAPEPPVAPTRQKNKALFPARSSHRVAFAYSQLTAFARGGGGGELLSDEQYTPLLAPAWSDAWLLTDGLFLLAVLGASPDVVTADLGRAFLATTYAAAAHTAFVRIFQEAFCCDQDAAGKNGHGLRIMCMMTHAAVFAFGIATWWLVFQRHSAAPVILSYVMLTSLMPSVAWLVYSVAVDLGGLPGVPLVSAAQFGFIVNGGLRFVYIAVLLGALPPAADDNATLLNYISLLEA